ncbi:MAG: hydroxyacylglutathione hydrolase [Rubrivivax sp.]|nr:hydroxyacylglutathione hydrolase [Rubrivivax sp.]
MRTELIPLPAFEDNYVWMLVRGGEALVVDPGDAAPVLAALEARDLRLAGILVTHHHGDHTGGLDALRSRLQGPVFAPARERIAGVVTPVREGDRATVLGLGFEVLDVPGHTAGHVAYYWPGDAAEAPILFCGDTLFSAGCGRLFEGTPAQMHASLAKLAALPGRTRVCCAHEYTLSNLRFAHAVEPDSADIADYRRQCDAKRRAGEPTLPSTIEVERRVNPFLRCSVPAVVRAARSRDPGLSKAEPTAADVLAVLREWKNQFR